MKLNELFIVQPVLASYRCHFINELSKSFDKVTVFSNLKADNGFKKNVDGDFYKVHTAFIGSRQRAYYQSGIIWPFLKNRPSCIFVTADLRAIHFWLLLFLGRAIGTKIFSHGQGLYDKPKPGFIRKALFKIIMMFSSKYVCYTNSVKNSLIDIGLKNNKLMVMDNTIKNEFCIEPSIKFDKSEHIDGLLFVGRLREGSNLELLFEALILLKKKGVSFTTDIVGDGSQSIYYKELAKKSKLDVIFHGSIYEDEKISKLSERAIMGVYPGDAGLSIVHYMSLSIVPIIHNDLTKHMGPEPSYIEDGVNGLLFSRNDKNSLADKIEKILNHKELSYEVSNNAFQTYKKLSEPSMAEKLLLEIGIKDA
jgi:glycosyltransferase involved in cell wall biosynthesis